MKKILFLASLVTLLMTSCGDSFFDLEPASKVTIDKVYKTASDYNVAVVGCYAKLQSQVNFYKAMLLCKGKILVNVDKGYEYFEDVQKILEETGTANQCVVKEKIPYQTIKEQHGDILDKVIFMPKADLCKPEAESIIDSYLQNEKPLAFEVRFSQVNDKVFELIKKLNDNGIKVFVNALWPAQNAEHDDDRAVELKQPDESWGWLIQQGFKLIQTDRPALLLDYLRAKKLHK